MSKKERQIIIIIKNYNFSPVFAEQLAWIWCICFAFLLPEVGTLVRSMRIVWFKSVRRGTFSDFFVVLCFEAMHVVGLSLLMFVVLPELDVVKGAMLTNCVAFIPSVFGKLKP